jgi:apolipoprotein N-acyltransferase
VLRQVAPAVLATALLYVLSFPSFNLGFLAWIAFVPLLNALPFGMPGRAAKLAFAAGFLANLGTLYWIYPTCRAGGVDPFVSALATAALSLYMASYWALFGAAAAFLDHGPGAARPVLLAAAWTAGEWLRTHFLTGFPWLLLGYSQWKTPALLSSAEAGGAYAVSFAVMLVNAGAALVLRDRAARRWDRGRRLAPSLAALAAFAAVTLALARPPAPSGPGFSVAVVQGNIDQYRKWDRSYEADIRSVYSRLTQEAAALPVDLIVWPETAVPGWIPNEEVYVNWVRETARAAGAHLLAGAASHGTGGDYNAAFLFTPAGEIAASYRKRHLVPFGEVIPFQKALSRWVRVLNELGEFAASNDWTVFETPKARFSANICFESMFPDLVRRFVLLGAQATVNMTNDGWYLDTAAPEQHFIASVFRAVETRTWVIRAANTGISGVIAPDGRVAARTKLMEATVLRGEAFPMDARTFYARRGDVFAAACAALAALGLLYAAYRRLSPRA